MTLKSSHPSIFLGTKGWRWWTVARWQVIGHSPCFCCWSKRCCFVPKQIVLVKTHRFIWMKQRHFDILRIWIWDLTKTQISLLYFNFFNCIPNILQTFNFMRFYSCQTQISTLKFNAFSFWSLILNLCKLIFNWPFNF